MAVSERVFERLITVMRLLIIPFNPRGSLPEQVVEEPRGTGRRRFTWRNGR